MEYNKTSPVAWDFICTPKSASGLEIKKCDIWSLVAIARHLCYITTDKRCPWIKWIRGINLKKARHLGSAKVC